jgi:thiol:disulfide interchange protein DsbD
MPAYIVILLALLSLFSPPLAALSVEDLLPPEQVYQLKATGISKDSVELEWQIADGYDMYQNKLKFLSQSEGVQLGKIDLPEGLHEHDVNFGEVSVYRQQLKLVVPLINPGRQATLKLQVKYQGCADIGVCYPPQKAVLEIALPDAPLAQKYGLDQLVQGLKGLKPKLFQAELLRPEEAFQFSANIIDEHSVHVSWQIADGYYLYKNKFALTLDGATSATLGELALPKGEAHLDEEFGQVEIYHNQVSVDVPLQRQSLAAETLTLTAKFQGCADRGVCYPPMTATVSLALPAATKASGQQPAAAVAVSEQDRIVDSLKQDSLALTLLTFFGFGLLLAHTPCIFPMIPILSGIIVGHGDRIGTRKALLLSASFVLASALMYTVFGILAALFGSNLQVISQQPWVIGVFSAIFVLLSLSMFGFYNLQLPSALQAKLHNSSEHHRDGSYWGAAIMGALSSLIVGPCVAAPLAAALIYIGQTGDVVLGGSALFVMGLGMGVPLLVIGASAGKLLPKAGPWLNSTKAVFGVIMLAVAAWMLSRIVPASISMLFAAMLLIIPAIYLNALEPLPQPASGWKKLWKGLGLMMLVFGFLQLIGLAAGGGNPLQPLSTFASTAVPGQAEAKPAGLQFQRIRSLAELEQKVQQAKAKQQWLMLDFYADWCISCKEMEAYTFSDAKVQQALQDFVVVQADVTEAGSEDMAMLQRFGLIGPPGIIFFGPDGQERSGNRVIGFQDAASFLQSLQQL